MAYKVGWDPTYKIGWDPTYKVGQDPTYKVGQDLTKQDILWWWTRTIVMNDRSSNDNIF